MPPTSSELLMSSGSSEQLCLIWREWAVGFAASGQQRAQWRSEAASSASPSLLPPPHWRGCSLPVYPRKPRLELGPLPCAHPTAHPEFRPTEPLLHDSGSDVSAFLLHPVPTQFQAQVLTVNCSASYKTRYHLLCEALPDSLPPDLISPCSGLSRLSDVIGR